MFKFKQFSIKQDKTAMKVGTDAVLLGAWVSLKNPYNVLDIGAGTGIISLMIAQRSDAEIEAVELESNAFEQCVENFENSPWADRLYCYNASFQELVEEIEEEEETYDLIVSNPPFYTQDYKSELEDRNLARFENSLPFEILIQGVSKLLSDSGNFTVIIPKKEEEQFINLAKSNNLYLNRLCDVQGNQTSEVKRVLLEFSRKITEIQKENLIIETQRHQYTEDYINLTKDFYLKM